MERIVLILLIGTGSLDIGGSSSRAAVILSVESVSVTAGETASVGFFATSDSSDVVSGFNLPIEVGNDGDGLPAGLAYHANPLQRPLFSSTDLASGLNSTFAIDGIANGSGATIVLGETATKLFDLVIDVASATTGLTPIPVHIINPTSPFNQFVFAGPGEITIAEIVPGILTVHPTPPLPGDFDSDGEVDSDDLMAWRIGFGIAIGADLLDGDGDGDRNVDGNDFYVWQRGFGDTNASLAVGFAIPEPGSLALMVGVLAASWAIGSRQERPDRSR